VLGGLVGGTLAGLLGWQGGDAAGRPCGQAGKLSGCPPNQLCMPEPFDPKARCTRVCESQQKACAQLFSGRWVYTCCPKDQDCCGNTPGVVTCRQLGEECPSSVA
jgi:hypothetical protein